MQIKVVQLYFFKKVFKLTFQYFLALTYKSVESNEGSWVKDEDEQ